MPQRGLPVTYHFLLTYRTDKPRAGGAAVRRPPDADARGKILGSKIGDGAGRGQGDGVARVRVLGGGAGVGGRIGARGPLSAAGRRPGRSEALAAAEDPPSSELPARHDGARPVTKHCSSNRRRSGPEDGGLPVGAWDVAARSRWTGIWRRDGDVGEDESETFLCSVRIGTVFCHRPDETAGAWFGVEGG